jgi:hypothetical protein
MRLILVEVCLQMVAKEFNVKEEKIFNDMISAFYYFRRKCRYKNKSMSFMYHLI